MSPALAWVSARCFSPRVPSAVRHNRNVTAVSIAYRGVCISLSHAYQCLHKRPVLFMRERVYYDLDCLLASCLARSATINSRMVIINDVITRSQPHYQRNTATALQQLLRRNMASAEEQFKTNDDPVMAGNYACLKDAIKLARAQNTSLLPLPLHS